MIRSYRIWNISTFLWQSSFEHCKWSLTMVFLIYTLGTSKLQMYILINCTENFQALKFRSSSSINIRQSQRECTSTKTDPEKWVEPLPVSDKQWKYVTCIKCLIKQWILTLAPLTAGVTRNNQPNRNSVVFGQHWPLDLFQDLVCCAA